MTQTALLTADKDSLANQLFTCEEFYNYDDDSDACYELIDKVNASRDYRYKRSGYAARGVAEYWIIDTSQSKFTTLTWVEGFYEETIYELGNTFISGIFLEIAITISDIFN